MKKTFWFRKIAGFILIGAAAIILFGFIVMTLWNAILPDIIHVSTITFGQALGILVLSKILFGGFGGGKGGGWQQRREHWKNNMQEKLAQMSPEEREKFKNNWRNKCSTWGRYPEKNTGSNFPEKNTETNIPAV